MLLWGRRLCIPTARPSVLARLCSAPPRCPGALCRTLTPVTLLSGCPSSQTGRRPSSQTVCHGRHRDLHFVAGSWLYSILYQTSLRTTSQSCFPEGSTLGSPRPLPQASWTGSLRQHGRGFCWAPEPEGAGRLPANCLGGPVGHHPSVQDRRHVSTTGVQTLSLRPGVDVCRLELVLWPVAGFCRAALPCLSPSTPKARVSILPAPALKPLQEPSFPPPADPWSWPRPSALPGPGHRV